MSRLPSVQQAVSELLRISDSKLNILINNAGVLAAPELHVAGLESQMAVHYWGAFLLLQLLSITLMFSSTISYSSRVINVSSKARRVERINFDDLHIVGKQGVFDGCPRSKLAQVSMASEIERRYGNRGLRGFSLDPGVVAPNEGSGIIRHVEESMREQWEDPVLERHMLIAA